MERGGKLFDRLCQEHTLLHAWNAVKQKGSSGGIDGMSVKLFDGQSDIFLEEIRQALLSGTWQPEPYMRISIPKNDKEQRTLGLLSVKDKVVQQAIKMLIEPRFENTFVSNSYGYRPGKGHGKAVRFARSCFQNKKTNFVLRLDIDNYFDTIDHQILFKRIYPLIADDEVFRLVQLCVRMGAVNKQMKWRESCMGVPQGAVLSPLLANFYLHPFDQFVLTRTGMYVRYADDFLILCETQEQTDKLLQECSAFLQDRLKLKLNAPAITSVTEGTEFLGILISRSGLSISSEKHGQLIARINTLEWKERGFCDKGLDALKGIQNYYMPLLPQTTLAALDESLISRLVCIVEQYHDKIPNKSVLKQALKDIPFFSEQNILRVSQIRSDIVNRFISVKSEEQKVINDGINKKLISARKREYRQRENETTELIVNTYGTFIGVGNKGITLKVMGKKRKLPIASNIEHITILCGGVSISSNALDYCMKNKISVDLFSGAGKHIGSFVSNRFMHTSLWGKQSTMSLEEKSRLAVAIISGKVRNQMNLIKYFHKYHKDSSDSLMDKFEEVIPAFKDALLELKTLVGKDDYASALISVEAKCAEHYWDYIEELLKDDKIGFTHRERKGATDLVNSLLNYGYAILYSRVWQALLYRKLNPTSSVIHVPQTGKPTFVYDVIELFRAQAVDRVVISLIQKKEPLNVQQGNLDNDTKSLLVKNIMERINRYEKYRGTECRFSDIINFQVKEIADFIDNGTKFKPYIAKW